MELPAAVRPHVRGMVAREITLGCTDARVVRYTDNGTTLYLKVETPGGEVDRQGELLAWLQGRLPVPALVARGPGWVLTRALPGETACDPGPLSRPAETVRALAQGLRVLWAVDIAECPFDMTLPVRLEQAAARVEGGLSDPSDWEPGTRAEFNSPAALYRYLVDNAPAQDAPVFTHGDYCLPNVLLQGGRVSGFIDLGRAGVASRWQDAALCVRSLAHNLKTTRWTEPFLEDLGLAQDPERMRYYTLLDELF